MSEPLATYTSHPVARLRMGPYRFESGILKLYSEREVKDFEQLLASMPPAESHRIKKVDLAAAEAIVRERLAAQGGPTKQVDSTVGERNTNGPKVGTGDLVADSKAASEKPALNIAGK